MPTEASESVIQRTVLMEAANRVAVDILARRTGIEALRHIADAARTLAGARYAALGVARPDGAGLLAFVTVGLTADKEEEIGPRPHGVGVLGLLLKAGQEPMRIDDLGRHSSSVGFPDNHPPMHSFLGVPIRRGDTVLGSLYLTEKIGASAFTDADEAAVIALGAHAAVAIYHLQLQEHQRALVAGLIAAQEEERRAVAYDLHDGLTQFVMAAHAHLESFRRAHAVGREEKAEKELEQGLLYLKEAVVESRRLVNGLRTLALDDLGLAGALELLLNEEKLRAGWVEATFVHNVASRRFDRSLETAAYRVAQEALTNARKHASAKTVRVLLLVTPVNPQVVGAVSEPARREERLTLEIRDWGRGFVPAEFEHAEGHVGLHSMAERVRMMDGRFDVNTSPEGGTTITGIFPVNDEGAGDNALDSILMPTAEASRNKESYDARQSE